MVSYVFTYSAYVIVQAPVALLMIHHIGKHCRMVKYKNAHNVKKVYTVRERVYINKQLIVLDWGLLVHISTHTKR